MFRYELSKHFTRFNIIFVSVMLVLNITVVFTPLYDLAEPEYQLIKEARASLLAEYHIDRERFFDEYSEHENKLKAYRTTAGAVFENNKINLDSYGDIKLYEDVMPIIERSEGYNENINGILFDAYSKIEELDGQTAGYVYEYNAALISAYTPLSGLEIPAREQYGWSDYFALKTPVIFSAVTVLGVFANMFLIEKRTKIVNIISISKKGGAPFILTKLLATGTLSVIMTLLFTLTPLAVFAVVSGLSDPSQYIQSLAGFEYCPYNLTIAQYLVIFTLLRTAAFLILSLFTALLGQLFSNELSVFVTFIAMLTASYALSLVSVSSPLFALRRFNFFDIAFVNIMFDRYRAVNVAGHAVGYLPFIIILLITSAIVCVAVSFAVGLKITRYRALSFKIKLKSTGPRGSGRSRGSYPSSLLSYEFYKNLLNSKGAALLLAVLVIKTVVSMYYYKPLETESERIKRDYIADLSGGLDESTADYIANERGYIRTSISEYQAAQTAYSAGEMTLDELRVYSERNNYANTVSNAFEQIETRYRYLKSISDDYDGIGFVYEAGAEKFLTPSLDIVLVLFILTVFSNVFTKEYDSGFIAILGLAKRGGTPTLRAKYLFGLITATAIYAVFSIIDLTCLLTNYGAGYLNAGIMSIPAYEPLRMNVSILQYFVLYKIVSYTGVVMLSVLVISVSAAAKKLPVSIIISAGIVFVPFALSVFGINTLGFVDITRLVSPMFVTECAVPALIYAAASAGVTVFAGGGYLRGDWYSAV